MLIKTVTRHFFQRGGTPRHDTPHATTPATMDATNDRRNKRRTPDGRRDGRHDGCRHDGRHPEERGAQPPRASKKGSKRVVQPPPTPLSSGVYVAVDVSAWRRPLAFADAVDTNTAIAAEARRIGHFLRSHSKGSDKIASCLHGALRVACFTT